MTDIDRLKTRIEEISPHQPIVNGIKASIMRDLFRKIAELEAIVDQGCQKSSDT